MSQSWIEQSFPGLAATGYQVTSEATETYNCIAYAAGDDSRWWDYWSGSYWPNAQPSPLIDDLVEVFLSLGFERCVNAEEEIGFQKVALYAKGLMWKHAAKQLPGGAWSSKLGPDEDIQHESPEALAGELYGVVHCIMRRQNDVGGLLH